MVPVSDDSDLEKLSSSSHGRKASTSEFSFHALFPNKDAGDDRAVDYTLASSEVAGA